MQASTTRTSLAAAAALMAIASIATSTPAFARHHQRAVQVSCFGVNACKGHSDCKSAHNDCKGMNSCKGQGFKHMTAAACTAAHGSLTAPN